jgi:uncharacterized iron-regulated membrane protein
MRAAVTTFHRWLGLIVGLLWAIQGLTGALFLFSRDIDHAIGPRATAGAQASLDAVLAGALAASGGRPVTRMATADEHGDIIAMYYVDGHGAPRDVLMDAHTAKAIGDRELEPRTPFSGSGWRWLYETHMALDTGRGGETVIGLSGLFLLLSLGLGLWLGWPRRGAWPTVFAAKRWRNLRMQLYGWHRVLGLTAGVLLVVSSLSGVYLAFPAQVRAFAAKVVPFQASYSPMAMGGDRPMEVLNGAIGAMKASHAGMSLGSAPIGPQRALQISLARFPKAHWVRVFLPTPEQPVISVRLRQPGEIRGWIGTTEIALDPATGYVLDVYDPLHAPFTNRLLDALFSIHNGELGGLAGRLLVMLLGFALPVFYVTGVWGWLHRRALARRSAQAPRGRTRPAAGSIDQRNPTGLEKVADELLHK